MPIPKVLLILAPNVSISEPHASHVGEVFDLFHLRMARLESRSLRFVASCSLPTINTRTQVLSSRKRVGLRL